MFHCGVVRSLLRRSKDVISGTYKPSRSRPTISSSTEESLRFLTPAFARHCFHGFRSHLKEPASEYSQPRVSPYRLAAHLTSASGIYCGLFWTGLSVVMPKPLAESVAWVHGAANVKRLALPISLLVGLTAVSGAFVAGNDALDHRILVTATLISVGTLWWSTRKLDIHPAVRSLIGSTIGMTALQVTLGVSTLLSYVPVSWGSAHQAGALTLLTLNDTAQSHCSQAIIVPFQISASSCQSKLIVSCYNFATDSSV